MSFFCNVVPYEVSHEALKGMKRRESWYLDPADCGEGWGAERIRTESKRAAAGGASSVLEVQVAATAAMKREPLIQRIRDEIDGYVGREGTGAKIVVLDGRHDNVDQLARDLRKALLDVAGVTVYNVHGGNTTPEKRELVRQAYMAHPGPCVFVATGESVGTAYNLHDTDLCFFAMIPWNGGDLHQWEKRFERLGMTRALRLVYCIIRGTVDERFVSRVLSKLPAMEKITADHETASAAGALGGTDDREAVATAILAELRALSPQDPDTEE
jgi:hypothetical protein